MAGQVVPKQEQHAIAQATFAAEWQQPLDEPLYKQILDRHALIAQELPRKQVGRGIFVSIGGAVTPTAAPSSISSLIFDKVEPGGESEWIMIVNPNHVSVTCHGRYYTRWSHVSARASGYLKFVLETVMPVRPIAIVALQYVDEFVWRGEDRDEFVADKLFQRGKQYLSPVVFDSIGLWHSHTGFWRKEREPINHRTLNNINVSVVDTTDQGRAAQIVMAHRLVLDEPLKEYRDDQFGQDGLVFRLLRRLHDLDKDVLRDLLLPAIAKKIHLDDRD